MKSQKDILVIMTFNIDKILFNIDKILFLKKWVVCFSVWQDNYTPLHIAVESAKPAVVETLLGYGADVHVRGLLTPLLLSACYRFPPSLPNILYIMLSTATSISYCDIYESQNKLFKNLYMQEVKVFD